MKNIKYIFLASLALVLTACNDIEDIDLTPEVVVPDLPALTAGSADFSTYVSLGNSLTAGFTDNALFKAGQENSMPNLLANKFGLVGGGAFTQPLTNDNIGGLLVGGMPIMGVNPRLVFDGAGPAGLAAVIGPVVPTTDIALNNPAGPFNNMGVPGAKSFHLLARWVRESGESWLQRNSYCKSLFCQNGRCCSQRQAYLADWLWHNRQLSFPFGHWQ